MLGLESDKRRTLPLLLLFCEVGAVINHLQSSELRHGKVNYLADGQTTSEVVTCLVVEVTAQATIKCVAKGWRWLSN